jgi:phosphatidylglycerophosphate synthase
MGNYDPRSQKSVSYAAEREARSSPVTHENHAFDRVVILADESANWIIGGLRQLERLILALNEFAEAAGYQFEIAVVIFWDPKIPATERWLPDNSRLVCIRPSGLVEALEPGTRVLTTRVFVARNSEFFQTAPAVKTDAPIGLSTKNWQKLSDHWKITNIASKEECGWRILERPADIGLAGRELLRRTGKTQDGAVSRFLNRPISRSITRLLLKFPIEPTTWTMSIFILPLLSCIFLMRGDYAGILIGTLLYHLYSILDGCDGEIARTKYLDSKRGGRIDDLCDIFGAFFFVIGLGLGLSRSHASALYAGEGVLCAMMIAATEWLLRLSKTESGPQSIALTSALYPRHLRLVQQSGLLFLGEGCVWWIVQLTKRDVSILFFVVLTLAGLPQWILHLWATVTAINLALTGIARLRTRLGSSRIVGPDSHS